MPTSNIDVLEIGIPGPPGSGVSAAEKATYVTLAGTNIFTNYNYVRFSATDAWRAGSGSASSAQAVVIDTLNKELELHNAAKLKGFSDAGITETYLLDAAAGTAQFDSTVSALRIIGESIELTLPALDGGGSVLTTGIKYDFKAPYNLTVTEWTLLGDQSGSIGIEFWKDSYANFPPTVADLVSGTTGTNNPRIVTATKGQSSTLTNWTTAWVQGDIIRVNVASITTLTRCGIYLKVLRT